MTVRAFIAYAPEDEGSVTELEKHLVLLKRQGVLDVWTKRRVIAGEEPDERVRAQLAEAQLVVLMVTVDLLASEYCTDVEIAPALTRHETGDAAVVPVVVRACTWDWGPFAELQALPRDGRPIEEHTSKDAAWTEVARGLRAAVERIAAQKNSASAPGNVRPAVALPLPGYCFGRDALVTDLATALVGESAPRIPILGPAGIGKTTVSLAALHREPVAKRFGARRYFVRLDAAPDASAAAAAIATAMRIEPGPDLRGRMLKELARAPTTLVLDNLETPWEQDLTETEELLAEFSSLPTMALVVSIRGAQQPGRVAWARPVRIQPLCEADAVDAFCRIAGEEHRHAPMLRPLLAKLAGVPLAITLLAHVAQGDDLKNLADEWEVRRTALLQRGGGPDRETSWEASLDLSLRSRRMTDDGRRLAALLGVLPDGVAQQDLRALLADAGPGAARVLAQLELAYFEAGRVRMLPPVREHLAAAHQPTVEDLARTMEHYRDLAQTLGPRPGWPGGEAAVARLAPEVANMDAVICKGLSGGYVAPSIDAAVALNNFVIRSGYVTALPLALARASAIAAGDIRRQANCIHSLAVIACQRLQHEQAQTMFEEAQSLYGRVGDKLFEANCMRALGGIAFQRGNHEQARTQYEKAASLYRQEGSVLGEANCMLGLAEIALQRSNHEQAREKYEAARLLYQQEGDVLGEANCMLGLARIDPLCSDQEQTRKTYEAARVLYRRVGALQGEARCIERLADLALGCSEYDKARTMYDEARLLYRQMGDLDGEANCAMGVGQIAHAQEDAQYARVCYEAALALYAEIPAPFSIGLTHRCLARLATAPNSRRSHVAAARSAWLSIGRPDLVDELGREFPPDPTP